MTNAIAMTTEQALATGWLTLPPDVRADMGKASENWSPEQLETAKWHLASLGRGYRTNRFLDSCMPKVSEKGKFFLGLRQRDVLFGGAAGPGKSHYLLASSIQFADVPGYSALLVRRTFKELSKGSKSLMTRARQWFTPLYPHVRWSSEQSSWVFRNKGGDAFLTFGYMEDEGDEFQYQSLEYDFVGFDEASHQREHQVLYLWSRLRRLINSDIPPRVRLGSNPGGPVDGGIWLKERYIPDAYLRASAEERFSDIHLWEKRSECGECGGSGRTKGEQCVYCEGTGESVRYFLPAWLRDNPFIDEAEYRRSLVHLGPVERKQLEDGDWDVVREGKVFRREWLRPWIRRGTTFLLRDPLDDESLHGHSPAGRSYNHNRFVEHTGTITFLTADTASTTKTWSNSTCICIWTLALASYDLMLRYGWKNKIETPDIMPKIIELYRGGWDQEWAEQFNFTPTVCDFAMIENKSSGIGIVQEGHSLASEGITIIPYNPGTNDKLSRATVAQKRFQSGQIWIPHGNPGWLQPLLRELLEFTGAKDGQDDFVDNCSMAAHYVANEHNSWKAGAASPPTEAMPGLMLQGSGLRSPGFGPGIGGMPGLRGW